MIQMGIGDDLIQVLHPRLGSGQQDDVVGFVLLLLFQLLPLLVGALHHRHGMHPHFPQHPQKFQKDHGAGVGVIVGPVVAAHIHMEIFADGIQLVVGQFIPQQIAGKHQRIGKGIVKLYVEPLPVVGDKARIKLGIVGDEA